MEANAGDSCFKCPKCSKVFAAKLTVWNHMKKCNDNFEINCEVCAVVCRGKNGLSNHMRAHQVVKCGKCDQEFNTNYMKQHMEVCQETEPNFKCDICSYKTLYKQNIVRHKVKCGKKESNLLCEKCNICINENIWEQHRADHEAKEDQVKCAEYKAETICTQKCIFCEQMFATAWNLNRHVKRKHINGAFQTPPKIKENYKCDQCDYFAVKPANLKRHQEQKHTSSQSRATTYRKRKCEFNESEDYMRKKVLKTNTENFIETTQIEKIMCKETRNDM